MIIGIYRLILFTQRKFRFCSITIDRVDEEVDGKDGIVYHNELCSIKTLVSRNCYVLLEYRLSAGDPLALAIIQEHLQPTQILSSIQYPIVQKNLFDVCLHWNYNLLLWFVGTQVKAGLFDLRMAHLPHVNR